ncbi:MAG: hypothetical protein SGI72_06095 [Planctomycetota bacterium]|nr:hypothetical protein [Planctomycetota bacterium]
MAADIGAIGWNWRGTILDSMGLVWPAALEYGSLNAIIAGESPEYVMLYADRFTLREFRARDDLYARYEPIARFSAFGLTDLAPRLEDVDVDWSQDYLIYRRR